MSDRVRFVAEYRGEHGGEPICRALEDSHAEIAPSTFSAAQSRPPSPRSLRDVELLVLIRKIHALLRWEGEKVAESTVRHLMRETGLRGISRANGPRTTKRLTAPRRASYH